MPILADENFDLLEAYDGIDNISLIFRSRFIPRFYLCDDFFKLTLPFLPKKSKQHVRIVSKGKNHSIFLFSVQNSPETSVSDGDPQQFSSNQNTTYKLLSPICVCFSRGKINTRKMCHTSIYKIYNDYSDSPFCRYMISCFQV